MNTFQLKLIKELIDVVSPGNLGDALVRITKGPEEATVEVRLINREVSFWVYEDGASILGHGIDDRFERPDYRDLSDLADAFLKRVISHISSFR